MLAGGITDSMNLAIALGIPRNITTELPNFRAWLARLQDKQWWRANWQAIPTRTCLHWLPVVLLLAFSLLDIISTEIALSMGHQELNPTMAALLAQSHLLAHSVKMAVTIGYTIAVLFLNMTFVLLFPVGFIAIVVVSNFLVILGG